MNEPGFAVRGTEEVGKALATDEASKAVLLAISVAWLPHYCRQLYELAAVLHLAIWHAIRWSQA